MYGIFDLAMPWWEFAARGVIVYVVVLVMLRASGKRSFGDLSTFDIVVLLVVGGSLRTAVVGKDTSLLGPLIAIAAILCADRAIGWISARWRRFNRVVEGEASIIARDGERDRAVLLKHGMPDAEFERKLHFAGLEDESTVQLARLEPNGKISLILKKDEKN